MKEQAGSRQPPAGRLVSLDAFRGAVMLLMASSGLGIPAVAKNFAENPGWRFFGHHFEHAEWAGCTLWDLIQPAFMFLVGAALPWSIARRREAGQSFATLLRHALWRSFLLLVLALLLTSNWSRRTEWVFTNVLAQIALGYPFLFLLGFAKTRTVWLSASAILFLYWLAFALHPLPAAEINWQAFGIRDDWKHFTGFAAHWEKSANLAASFDRWFLNLFPRETPFVYNTGGYQTLNFIPSLATMLFGLLAGRLLRAPFPVGRKLKLLLLAGCGGIVLGLALQALGLCPIVKRIWTPAWTLFSGGMVALLLATFVALLDGRAPSRWSLPLVVAGLNPITLYCMWQLMSGFVRDNLKTHLGREFFSSLGIAYGPILERASVLLIFWLILFWMYRRKIFIRI